MRCFIAIELAPEVKEYLATVQQETQKFCRRGSYTPQNNIHLNVQVLGEIAPSDVEYIKEAMFETAQRNKAFTLQLDRLGFFGKGDRGVLWAGLKKSTSLERLFFGLSKSMERQGFARDKKGQALHITLGRDVEPQRGYTDVQKAVRLEPITIPVERIVLMESKRRGTDLFYRTIFAQDLKKPQPRTARNEK
ncbi:RNA 2',3'-cyclic phosphodiesterase [Chakrabartyella piscis]|uniref:RNA 2',3'-cyclic phosphodiesterase n=1 Tax=Chakrabartyella piscis TaxID=2918914 RepID=UPI0029583E02|nr:RNA 2',3'-cyclic phosphodiesterase [Chakrabartyella piscis]